MRKILKPALIILGAAILFAVFAVSFWNYLPFKNLLSFKKLTASLLQISQKVIAPGPLIGKEDYPSAYLTQSGVLQWTNYYRKDGGLAPLALNSALNSAAGMKLKDMFANQYFEHVSPQGLGPSYWVETSGYSYILTGENLALGNFKDDKALVGGWMASPGHRANIMNAKYSEIGIAVGRGIYQGQSVWMAVQEFGMPKSACSEPDAAIKSQIAQYQSQLDSLEAQILSLHAELKIRKIKNIEEYNKKVDRYNALILEYQSLAKAVNDLAGKYNSQAQKFNNCAGG